MYLSSEVVPTRYAGRNAEFAAVGSRTHYSPRLQPHHSHTWPSARRGSPTLTRSLPHVRAQAAHPARKDGQAAKEADARLKSCDNDVSAACSPQRLSVSRRIQDHWSRTGALERAASSNNQSYAHAAPFPHVSLDGLFPRWIIHALQLEVPDNMSAALAPGADPGQASLPEPRRGWRLTGRPNTVKGGFLKYSLNDERLMGPHVQVSKHTRSKSPAGRVLHAVFLLILPSVGAGCNRSDEVCNVHSLPREAHWHHATADRRKQRRLGRAPDCKRWPSLKFLTL